MQNSIQKANLSKQCTYLVYALIFLLVFEGLIRKMLPSLRTPIFFLKDVLCLLGLFLLYKLHFFGALEAITKKWWLLTVMFFPLLFFTASKDVIIALYGAKQYLLYVVVVMFVAVSFPVRNQAMFRLFLFHVALLLIPTSFVAIMQNALPPSHWLNLSVGGESLEAFSAEGYLRVGSTFSFTGQYSWFLVAETFVLAASFFLPPTFQSRILKKTQIVIYPFLTGMLIIGAFITGGRSAVIGCASTIALGLVLIGMKKPQWMLTKGLAVLFLSVIGLAGLRTAKPEFFKAYDKRSEGSGKVAHNEEILGRVIEGLFSWTDWFHQQETVAVLLGNGIGVMSNGSQQISPYAAAIRANGFWTEGDVPTTFWEGGLYLAFIWYGFRISVILLCVGIWKAIKEPRLAMAASVPLAHVIISGLLGQFGMQPPLCIWWWLAVGLIIVIHQLEKENLPFSGSREIAF